ncbi:hypothetical protein [Kribbella sp. NBC_00889]|uniref:hypothetical protein n=1 Tax=Kribbella sp. NBC_00889 TaxID=2975974 RepID=UPI00386CD3D2|nr:hypothetical protein OG817_22780 [Kribbella sp. NBC_00889]
MDAMPGRPEVFLLEDDERVVVPGGPTLVGPHGERREIPAKVYDVMRFVEAALLQGLAVQVTPLRSELTIDEAADAIEMDRDELRLYASRGDLPIRSSEYGDWVRLADVLALNARVNAEREQALQAMAEDDGSGAGR